MVLTLSEVMIFLKESPKLSEKYECTTFKIPSSVCVLTNVYEILAQIFIKHTFNPTTMYFIFTLLILLCSGVKTKKYNSQTQHIFATNSYMFQLYKQAIIKLYKKTKYII